MNAKNADTDTSLDLHDLQGNLIKAYPRFDLPRARYLFFRINDGEAGRVFVSKIIPMVTTAAPWAASRGAEHRARRPPVTTNIAFTFDGLERIGVPQASLQSFPQEFAMGMRARQNILGDDGPSAPEHWDPIWTGTDHVHIFISLNAIDAPRLDAHTRAILDLLGAPGGVELLSGHRGDGGKTEPYQEASAIYIGGQAVAQEHFGYTDGISNPFFKGAGADSATVVGGGKVTGADPSTLAGWAPLETGEFLLGYKDEAFEYPVAPIPGPLADNGTFMVYRKLHQNVGSFDAYLESASVGFPEGKEALAAKLAGRWRNGAPLSRFPIESEANDFAMKWAMAKLAVSQAKTHEERERNKRAFAALNDKFVAFDYTSDLEGTRCPVGAHARRTNPRSALEFGATGAFETPGALSNRRRLIRRGLPYGDSQNERDDEGNHGIIFMAFCASVRRQFEFVQQQWLNYGNDFRLGNDKDPLTGNHDPESTGRMVIQRSEQDPNPPFFCNKFTRFVETRGGDYFFVPSLTALRLIGRGLVDPT
ncbi:MAG TPA: hypothetical protein VF395_07250 [Polyangiaceae bacterium]